MVINIFTVGQNRVSCKIVPSVMRHRWGCHHSSPLRTWSGSRVNVVRNTWGVTVGSIAVCHWCLGNWILRISLLRSLDLDSVYLLHGHFKTSH